MRIFLHHFCENGTRKGCSTSNDPSPPLMGNNFLQQCGKSVGLFYETFPWGNCCSLNHGKEKPFLRCFLRKQCFTSVFCLFWLFHGFLRHHFLEKLQKQLNFYNAVENLFLLFCMLEEIRKSMGHAITKLQAQLGSLWATQSLSYKHNL